MKISNCNFHLGSFLAGYFADNAFLVISEKGNDNREHRASVWVGHPTALTCDDSGFVSYKRGGQPGLTQGTNMLVSNLSFLNCGNDLFHELGHHGFYSMNQWQMNHADGMIIVSRV